MPRRQAPVTLTVLPPNAGTRASPIRAYRLRASTADDLTVQRVVTGLRPGTRYRYRFWQRDVSSPLGTFTTAPRATANVRVRFALTGDADATPGPNGRPGFNGFETYGAMARAGNDFNVNFGDTIYSDSELAGAAIARTVGEKRAKYRLGLALAPLRRLRAAAGLYSGWDDHEFVNDFARDEHGDAIYRAGVEAFLELRAVDVQAGDGAVPELPLGEEPRALLPRRAQLPEREGDRRLRRRHRADRSRRRAPGVRRPGARRSRARCPRRASTRSPRPSRTLLGARAARCLHEGDPGLDRDLQGRRQPGAADAALRAPVRPLGGLRGGPCAACSTRSAASGTSSSSRRTPTRT